MSLALYRLGRWCSAHAVRVLVFWVVLLVALGGAAARFAPTPTSEVRIPGSQFQTVVDQLGQTIPAAAGGFGTVVVRSTTGPFTEAQRSALTATFAEWTTLPHVDEVIDPFAAQARIDAGAASLAGAKADLDAGQRKLADGRAKLQSARGQLDYGAKLLAGMAATDPGRATLSAQLAAGERQYASAKAQLDTATAKYVAGRASYDRGARTQEATQGLRMVSADGTVALVQVRFDTNVRSVPEPDRAQIPARAADLADQGLQLDYSVDITQDTKLVGPGEVVGLVIAGLVLVGVLGSLLAAGLPLLVALLGVGVGLAGAFALSATIAPLHQMTPSLALMLGLAVGIDYALFIVNRHRGQYLRGMPLRESIARSVGTAGSAVLFAGLTVVIALVALLLSGIPLLGQMGLVAAGTVAVAVLIAVTVTPAGLALLGRRVARPATWRKAGYAVPGDSATRMVSPDEHEEEHGGWYVRAVTTHPWRAVFAVLAVIGLLAAPATSLRLGLPDGGSEPAGSKAKTTKTTQAETFGPGMNGPIVAVATLPKGVTADEVAAAKADLAQSFLHVVGVERVVPFGESTDHRTLAFQIVPKTGPADAQTAETVSTLLASADGFGKAHGATIGYTGQTVANIEISQVLANALPRYLLVVVGLSLLVLILVFRSILVPVMATFGFLLSVAAAFGVTVAVYQWGWLGSLLGVTQPGPILSFMPIMLVGVLFGLAMDYQMFLVSGMREAWAHGEAPQQAVRTGFLHGAKVVTAAALIMTSVFGGFVFAHLTMIRPIGLGLAVGVIVDAWLVRMTLVPALMHLVGRASWWLPAGWARRLPDVDVEGAKLTAHLAEEAAVARARAAREERVGASPAG